MQKKSEDVSEEHQKGKGGRVPLNWAWPSHVQNIFQANENFDDGPGRSTLFSNNKIQISLDKFSIRVNLSGPTLCEDLQQLFLRRVSHNFFFANTRRQAYFLTFFWSEMKKNTSPKKMKIF